MTMCTVPKLYRDIVHGAKSNSDGVSYVADQISGLFHSSRSIDCFYRLHDFHKSPSCLRGNELSKRVSCNLFHDSKLRGGAGERKSRISSVMKSMKPTALGD